MIEHWFFNVTGGIGVPIVTIVKHKTSPAGHTKKPTSGICFGIALTGTNQPSATLHCKAGGGRRKGIPRSVSCLLYATLQPGRALSSLHHPVSSAERSDIFLRPNVERLANQPEHSLLIPTQAELIAWNAGSRLGRLQSRQGSRATVKQACRLRPFRSWAAVINPQDGNGSRDTPGVPGSKTEIRGDSGSEGSCEHRSCETQCEEGMSDSETGKAMPRREDGAGD
jgi:hypothetical protein